MYTICINGGRRDSPIIEKHRLYVIIFKIYFFLKAENCNVYSRDYVLYMSGFSVYFFCLCAALVFVYNMYLVTNNQSYTQAEKGYQKVTST
jgi:hypothetical protein